MFIGNSIKNALFLKNQNAERQSLKLLINTIVAAFKNDKNENTKYL